MTPTSLLWRKQLAQLQRFLRRGLGSTLGRNILSLYGLQFANYIVPLIAVPYLVRVLGPEKFGAVAFGQSLMMYFVLLVNYGFNWSATRTISVQRDDPQRVSKTASAVLGAKVLLTMVSLGILSLLVAIVPKFQEMSALLYLLFGIVIGNALFPQWLFQGLERMVAISVINLSMRVLAVAGIFILVHEPADYLKYAGLLGLQWVGAGIVGLIWALLGLRVTPALPALSEIVEAVKEGWTIFLSTAAISFYTTGNVFILGLLTNNTIVGYYAAVEKIVKALQGLVGPLSQAFYPRISYEASRSKEKGLLWARRALFLMGAVGLLVSLGTLIGAPLIVRFLLGEMYEPSIVVLQILAFIPFLVGLSNVFGVNIMLVFHLDKIFLTILFAAGVMNVLLALLVVPLWQQNGMATAVLAMEFLVTVTMAGYLATQNLLPLKTGRNK